MAGGVGRNLVSRKKKARLDVRHDARFDWHKETHKIDTRLLGKIQRRIVAANAERNESRDTENLHASEMCKPDWCERASWYRMTGVSQSDPGKAVTHHTAGLYEEGHEIHEKYQRWMWDLGILEGLFECLVCEHLWWSCSPDECVSCKQPRRVLVYREVPIISTTMRIVGHADGQLNDDKGRALVELKSIGLGTFRFEVPGIYKRFNDGEMTAQEMWKEIRRPFSSHLKQVMIYMYVTGIHTCVFIYEFKANQQQKEFVVRFQPKLIEDIIAKIDIVNEAMNKGKVVRRPEWAEEDHKTCKACVYRSTCWKLNEPAPDPQEQRLARPVLVRRRAA